MPKLKVLNLFGLQQSSLPSSIDLLRNLQTLCLDYSKVKDFTIIGRLKTLKVLSLQNSVIEEFPIEMSQLTQLRLLDLSNCWKLEGMPTNVISQLSQLEDFFLKGCPIKWKYEELAELKLLSKLTSLELDIKDNNVLPRDFFSKELKRYKISVGDWFFRYPIKSNLVENLRILKFQSNSTVSLEEICGIKKVEVLCIAKSSNDAKDLDETLMRPLFNEKINSNLKVFEWIDGREKRRICWQSQSKTLTICNTNIPIGLLKRFYNLKKLELFEIQNKEIKGLFDLRDLEVLHVLSCHRLMSLLSFSASFQNLKVLNICSYHGLVMKLITPSMAKSLVQLREMSIHYIETFTEIVEYEGDATTMDIVFDNLNKLSLTNLENLICFCSGNYSFSFPSLERLIIERCPNMKIFSPGSLSTPKLHNVYYEKKL
ncbi:disease resistance protein RUN1-like isoform X1 [Mangifera indica]|uniref:disease resistance protein RUN1-like isoform X1 n=1 Tax=Mangifera indica TaxID=29780 RepID=UPI001CFAE106|nr:disease resistance protein RUN1-like isoform X1 [Mangifera indica]XP_044481634.1 disease resistance protein RUN1-like isoform X1 [Mangifera indica]XP_044481635.1 disease resistance protein RUN1-like isoform X1 [Mangifera indica]XP_044481636.1 disease resistance protein RUN1-like isoform X1 [Mangifera indica]XP_044481637.1 disease resistance protein RUN1-like isoform X1 [Mangifera indica]